jgi:thioester reductase-like protein
MRVMERQYRSLTFQGIDYPDMLSCSLGLSEKATYYPTVNGAPPQYDSSQIDTFPTTTTSIIMGEQPKFAIPQVSASEKYAIIAIEAMITKYSVGLDSIQPVERMPGLLPDKRVILVTGTTGSLGSQLLVDLLCDESVEKVYTFNRPALRPNGPSIFARHKERFVDRGLDVSLLASEKLVFVEAKAAAPNLGLSEALYAEVRERCPVGTQFQYSFTSSRQLRDKVTVIIHNAWKLDLSQPLASFESNIRGLRNLIDFARSGAYASSIRFLFTSTVGISRSWNNADGMFPEDIVHDPRVCIGVGYGEGKYVAEMVSVIVLIPQWMKQPCSLLAQILAKSGIQFTTFRISQIAGGFPNGAWAITDLISIVLKSSLALGVFPTAAGVSDLEPSVFFNMNILLSRRCPGFLCTPSQKL